MIVFLNGKYMPKEKAKISVDDRGFLFADGLYDVIRSYNGRMFRPDAHLERFERGARQLRIDFDSTLDLKAIALRLLTENRLSRDDAIIYMQTTRGVAPRTHRFPPAGTKPTLYITASKFQPQTEELSRGTNAILVPDQRWSRCDIKSIALLPNVLFHQQARENVATEALFVRDGVVLEGTHTNFAAVVDGVVVTAPRTNYLLHGITRAIVIDLCRELRIPLREEPVFENLVFDADELMIVGTTVEITPVVRINGIPIGSGSPGPITRRLQQAFRELT